MPQDSLLAISSEATAQPLDGRETREPAFGVAAKIDRAKPSRTSFGGRLCKIVDQTSVLTTHLAEVIKQHAHELLTRQETKRLLDALAESQPKLVEELVPKLLSLGDVQKVLQQLLREQVSVRDLVTILETLLDAGAIEQESHPLGGGRPAVFRAGAGSAIDWRRWQAYRHPARRGRRRTARASP